MDINKLSIEEGDSVYYSKSYMDMLESHIPYLINSKESDVFIVDKDKAYVYRGDLFGYLNYRNVPPKHHWICMRVNGYFSPFEFSEEADSIIVPSSQELDQIRISYMNSGLVSF